MFGLARSFSASLTSKLLHVLIAVLGVVLLTYTAGAATPSLNKAAPAVADPAAASPAKSIARAATPHFNIGQVQFINQQIRRGWGDHKIQPSPPATDFEWCRRVYLDILGRAPSVAELELFLRDKPPNRKLNLVNRLLGEGPVAKEDDQKLNDQYTEEYARHWTTLWTNILIGRNGGMEPQSMISREGMQQYLRRAFLKDKPYDAMVRELVTATGANQPGEKNSNGAVNFLVGKLDENGVQATAKTAQIFLGLQVQCTQCHNHPFNDWKQNQFWQLNAFFRQTHARRLQGPRGMAPVELYNSDFAGENNNPERALLYYDLRNGTVGSAEPVFVDGTAISPSGRLSEVDRRKELAELILRSEYMPMAMINRTWAHFLGYGFTKPIDDMGPHNQPTHPELLQQLAYDFRANGYNIKHLIRWIVLSEPYSLSSRSVKGNERDDPSLGERPLFSKFYLRQMSAEQLYESLIVATQAQKTQGTYEEQERAKADWLRQFTIAFGTDEGDEATTFNGTIPQVLMMFNGDLIRRATSGDKRSFLDQVNSNPNLNYQGKVNFLFLSALARRATSKEMQFCEGTLLAGHKGDQLKALQDVFWVVLNSNEFILNH